MIAGAESENSDGQALSWLGSCQPRMRDREHRQRHREKSSQAHGQRTYQVTRASSEQIRHTASLGCRRRIRHELDLEDARPQLAGERQMPGGRKVRDSIQNVRGLRLPRREQAGSVNPSGHFAGARIDACDVVVLPDVGVDDALHAFQFIEVAHGLVPLGGP